MLTEFQRFFDVLKINLKTKTKLNIKIKIKSPKIASVWTILEISTAMTSRCLYLRGASCIFSKMELLFIPKKFAALILCNCRLFLLLMTLNMSCDLAFAPLMRFSF